MICFTSAFEKIPLYMVRQRPPNSLTQSVLRQATDASRAIGTETQERVNRPTMLIAGVRAAQDRGQYQPGVKPILVLILL